MRTIIYLHKVDGLGFIQGWQDHVQYLDDSTGDTKWQSSLKSWEGEIEYNAPIPMLNGPSNIGIFFPDHDGDAYFVLTGGMVKFQGSGPLKKNGKDVL